MYFRFFFSYYQLESIFQTNKYNQNISHPFSAATRGVSSSLLQVRGQKDNNIIKFIEVKLQASR